MIDLNTASADALDGIEMLRGHGFESFAIVRKEVVSPAFASSMRYRV